MAGENSNLEKTHTLITLDLSAKDIILIFVINTKKI